MQSRSPKFTLLSLLSLNRKCSGGLETIFGGAKQAALDVPLPAGRGGEGGTPPPSTTATTTVAAVVATARADLLTGKPDLFLSPDGSGSVRPGILVLVNDTDWELW